MTTRKAGGSRSTSTSRFGPVGYKSNWRPISKHFKHYRVDMPVHRLAVGDFDPAFEDPENRKYLGTPRHRASVDATLRRQWRRDHAVREEG